MKKLMSFILLLLLIAGFLALEPSYMVSAFDPPGQSGENATDVIIWHSGNLTVDSANISIVGLEDALVAATEAQAEALNENNSDIALDYLTLLVVALLIGLVFWQRSLIMYAVGSPVAIVYGLSLAIPSADLDLWVAGVAIAVIGTYFLYCIIMVAFNWKRRKVK